MAHDVTADKFELRFDDAARLVAPYGDAFNFELLAGGLLNSNFRVELEGDRPVLLRVYPRTRSEEEIRFELEVLARLERSQCAVPKVISGDQIGRVRGRPYIVMEYIDGRTLGEEDLSYDLAQEAGHLLRRLHTGLLGFRPRARKDRHDVKYIRALLDETAGVLDEVGRDELDQISEAVLLRVGREEWVDEPLGVVHADYYVENLIRMPGGDLALIDFDDSYYGTQLFDLAIGAMEFAALKDQTLDPSRLDAFVKAYGFDDDYQQLYRAMAVNCLRFLCYTLPLTREAGGRVSDNAYAQRAGSLLAQL